MNQVIIPPLDITDEEVRKLWLEKQNKIATKICIILGIVMVIILYAFCEFIQWYLG